MADNWAERPDEQQDPDAPDNQNLVEADANKDLIVTDDAVEENVKPKRNRAPTIGAADDIQDDGNLDEAPKPKRGRGRPRKEDDPQHTALIRKELEDFRNENARLQDLLRKCTSERDDLEKDLELTRSSLVERDNDYQELLDQFSNHEENSAQAAASKPIGLVFYDDITESCVSKLKSTISWSKIKKGLGDITDADGINEADLVLVLTGASEIESGVSAFHLHQTLRRLLLDNNGQTLIYVANLPPNNNARVQVDLYNHKLNSMESENVHIIKMKFHGSKLELVGYNGSTPSQKCISLYDDALQAIPAPTNLKSKNPATSGESKVDFDISTVIPIKPEFVGRIIGKSGKVIKGITSECNVRMSFGNWKEKTSESREDEPESFTGVMIKGRAANVKRASELVYEIIGQKAK